MVWTEPNIPKKAKYKLIEDIIKNRESVKLDGRNMESALRYI